MNQAMDAMDFRRQLLEEVMPFWEAHAIDDRYGGYCTYLLRDGARYSQGDKYLVMQTRMIYSFSIAYRVSGDARHLRLAGLGVEFLVDKFRDRQREGWVWTVSREGEQLDRAKRPYGLAFAVYALAEYARVSGDRNVLELAQRTWELLSSRAWDQQLGGFFHELGEDWTPVTTTKRIDTILHNLEGVSALFAATGDDQYLADLRRLCHTLVERTWDPASACTHEWFYRDWREDLTNTNGLANYGHVAETAWFSATIGAYTGEARYRDFAQAEMDYALTHGWDEEHGGLFSHGQPNAEVTDRTKVWWMQSEFLDALALFYRLTGEQRYADLLRQHAQYIFTGQRDAVFGEWYARCASDGTPIDPRKGFEHKAAYHVVQGLYQADRHLRAALGERSPEEGWLEWAL